MAVVRGELTAMGSDGHKHRHEHSHGHGRRHGKSTVEYADSDDFKKTVQMLLELLGRDMSSANPSRDRDLLIAVREALFRVEVAGQLFDLIKGYHQLLAKNFEEVEHFGFDKERHIKLSKEISKLAVQSFSGKAEIFDMLKEFGIDVNNLQMAIFAITQFIEMVRRFPMKLFEDLDNRIQVINALQLELDDLITQEEEEQAEEEEEEETDED
jgi:type III secretion protein W